MKNKIKKNKENLNYILYTKKLKLKNTLRLAIGILKQPPILYGYPSQNLYKGTCFNTMIGEGSVRP